jgi:hypothetical protein
MTAAEVKNGLDELDALAQSEYGKGLLEIWRGDDSTMARKRLARLTGIVLKRPLAMRGGPDPFSESGARPA